MRTIHLAILALGVMGIASWTHAQQMPPQMPRHPQMQHMHQGTPNQPTQDPHAGHGGSSTTDSPSTKAFREANARMHRDMDIAFSGDADRDFVAGMIPHHQGAIDMARIVLQHGKDPEIRKLAQEIVAAQDKEIAFMRTWQQKAR